MSERYYTISTTTAEIFNEVNTELTTGSLISRNVECVDIMEHSPTRAEYLLTDAEAETVKKDNRIKLINLTPARYPDIYNATEEDLIVGNTNADYNRYGQNVKNWQAWGSSSSFTQDDPSDVSRASSQLIRMKQKRNPWISGSVSETSAIEQDPVQKGAGENVDIIIADNGTWIGHVEFINPNRVNFDAGAPVSPQDYTGGNVLPGDGYCDVLDLVLDGPYYIDPDWFNADPSNRLMTRWDGTTVPVETAAREWWNVNTKRSSNFANAGTVTISSSYTRDGVHGSNTAHPSTASANHGTQCASLTYGRTHGWAYNANKWHLNALSFGNPGSIERCFDIQKIFHQNKPVHINYGNRNPTISSNSWGFRSSGKFLNYYFFQSATGTAYGGLNDEPEFIKHMGTVGDGGRWKSEMYDNSMTQAGKELADSGVIFVVAAGNSGQMQVNPDDPNYDNHLGNNSDTVVYYDDSGTFPPPTNSGDFNYLNGYLSTYTTNRRGFPQHLGKTEERTFQGNTTVKFPAINVGALDDNLSTGGKERKVNYSDMGNAIDIYAPADGTIGAVTDVLGFMPTRFDDSYTGLSTINGHKCRDAYFNGTSAACPVVAGFLATVLQYNRGWTYEDIRNWIQTSVTVQDSADFYDDTRGTTAEGSEWSDSARLQGGDARVLWLASYPNTNGGLVFPQLGKIYAKTSSDIVNSLTDKVLIINRGSAYQVPFYNNSGNYNEIKFSMLVSFTDSDNDDISGFYNTFNNPVTGTSKETFSYIGFTTNDGVTGVPTTNGVDFIGIRYNMFITAVNSSGNSNIKNNLISDSTIFQNISTYRGGTSSSRIGENGKFGYYATSDTTTLCASYYPNAINLKDQPPKWKVFGLPHRWGANYNYFLYVGMGIEVIDKGLSTQKLRLKLYQSFGPTTGITNSAGVQYWTDASMYGSIPGPAPDKVNLPNLRYGSNVDDYLAEYQDIPWNKDGAALDLPINFFWYNSLPDLRPRISTLHGRVLS